MSKDEDDKEDLLVRFHRQEEESRKKLRGEIESVISAARRVLAEARPGDSLFMAEGQYSPHPSIAERQLFFVCLPGQAPRLLHDAWIEKGQEADCLARIARKHPIRKAGCDAMYATLAHWIWTADAAMPFELWDRKGRSLVLDDVAVVLNPDAQKPRLIPRPDVVSVHGTLSEDWVTRTVCFKCQDGSIIEVATDTDLVATVDPCYDAWDIMCDASWVRTLATVLSAMLGVEVSLDEAI